MKIKASDLPAHIAEALKPRTFAQEVPEEGQQIEIYVNGKWEHGAYSSKHPGTVGMQWIAPADRLWRPVLELEAPEPARALPKPKRGSYFIVSGRLAYKSTGKECWRYRADENGITKHENYQFLAALPEDWTPLSDMIAKAARAQELEAIEEGLNATVRRLESALDQTRLRYRDHAVTIETLNQTVEELQAKIKQQDAELERSKEPLRSRERLVNLARMERVISEQEHMLYLASVATAKDAEGNWQVVYVEAAECLHERLEARRKAREAS